MIRLERDHMVLGAEIPGVGAVYGADAIYAGISLSSEEDRLVHLILWKWIPNDRAMHMAAERLAGYVSVSNNSHLPTRIQCITLQKNVSNDFLPRDTWLWTSTKDDDRYEAYSHNFSSGIQVPDPLDREYKWLAVSEIEVFGGHRG